MNHIGIDLGTTNSVACTMQDGQFVFLDFRRSDLLPSVLLYQGGKVSVGAAAKRKSETFPQNYISSAKTYMGSTDTLKEIEGRCFTPTDVATEVLAEIYRVAQKYFANDDPIEAVITTPAYFDSVQNFETERAGKAAGFIVKQILPEPVSAALAYAMDDCNPGEKIYVVDLGGGTFDVTLLEVVNRNEFNTLMKAGDNHLGGDNFDDAIMEIMYRAIRLSAGINLADEQESGLSAEVYGKVQQKLKGAAERCKCDLSTSDRTEVNIVSLFPHKEGHYDFSLTLTRQEFLEEASLYVNKVKNTIKHSFDDLDYDQSAVDRVILVGGSARMPFLRDFVKEFFDKEPYADKDLAKLVAMGAALKANDENETIISRDIITRSLGIELVGKRFAVILPKNKVYPCDNSDAPDSERIFTTVYDYQESVDINVYVGEDDNVDNNTFYDGFTLDGIERAPCGVPQIEVIFSFDKSQILHVTSRDLRTGASSGKEIAIDRNGGKKK